MLHYNNDEKVFIFPSYNDIGCGQIKCKGNNIVFELFKNYQEIQKETNKKAKVVEQLVDAWIMVTD